MVSRVVTHINTRHRATTKVGTDKITKVGTDKITKAGTNLKEGTDRKGATPTITAVMLMQIAVEATQDHRRADHMEVTVDNRKRVLTDDNRNPVLMEDNRKRVLTDDNRNPVLMEDKRNLALTDDNRNLALMGDSRKRVLMVDMGDNKKRAVTVDLNRTRMEDTDVKQVTSLRHIVKDHDLVRFHHQLVREDRESVMHERSNLRDQTKDGIASQRQRR